MKVSKLAIAIAMASGLAVTPAFAQNGRQSPVQRTGFEYGSYDYYAQDDSIASPGDRIVPNGGGNSAAPAPADPIPQAANGGNGAAPAGCDSCGGGGCDTCNTCSTGCADDCLECDDEVHRLFDNCCCLQSHGLNITGWVAQGFTANPDDPSDRFNGPVTFNDRANEYQLNQIYAIIEKPLVTDCGWDIGGRVDLLYGSDYRFTLARGLDAEGDFTAKFNSSRFYGLAIPQAYGEIGGENLRVKLGHFYTIIGYEVVTAPDNFFYSHAYTMQYGEPFTHTGALATYTVNDQLTLMGGITNGWDNFDDQNDAQSFLGGVTFSSSDASQKLALALHTGEEEIVIGTGETSNRTIYSAVYTNTLSDRLTYVFQHDNGWQEDAPGFEEAQWYSINQYLIYQINCCWSAGVRAEWFRDDDGFRVFPAGDYAARGPLENNNIASAGGFEGDFWEITAGLNYKPTANLKIRPELRYDWFDGRATNGVQPYDGGTDDSQFLAAFDVIYLW